MKYGDCSFFFRRSIFGPIFIALKPEVTKVVANKKLVRASNHAASLQTKRGLGPPESGRSIRHWTPPIFMYNASDELWGHNAHSGRSQFSYQMLRPIFILM